MPSARRAEASTSEADDSMHLGLLFVALFGVYNCDLQKVKDEGAKLCFCVSDAVQFVQQKWHCAEIAKMLGWAASLFHTASACLLLMDITTGDIPRMALPDMYIPCDEKEPLDCESWLAQSCAGRINWKEKLKQLVMAFEFLEELSSDEHLDAMWRKKIKSIRTIIQDVVFPMAVRVNLMIARGETLCGIIIVHAERFQFDRDEFKSSEFAGCRIRIQKIDALIYLWLRCCLATLFSWLLA